MTKHVKFVTKKEETISEGGQGSEKSRHLLDTMSLRKLRVSKYNIRSDWIQYAYLISIN